MTCHSKKNIGEIISGFYIIPVMQLFPNFSFPEESIEFLGSFSSFLASYFLYKKMVGVK